MPFNIIEHEKQILGAIKGDQHLIDDYMITENLFFDVNNKRMFNIFKEIHSEGKKIDPIIILEKLEKYNMQDKVAYFSDLEIFYSSNIEFYINKQKEFYKLRELEILGMLIGDWKKDKTPEEIIVLIDDKITELSMEKESYTCKIGECLSNVLEEIEEAYKSKGKIKGVESGFSQLDNKLNGFCEGDFIVIGARTSLGKTALALNMADNIARKKIPVGIISIEMMRNILTMRLLSSKANLNLYSVRSGYMKNQDFYNLTEAATSIYEFPLYIHDEPGIKLSKVLSILRKWKRAGIKIVFIDYFTMIEHDNESLKKRDAYGKISKALKTAARKLRLPIAVLSQLNREAEGKKPTMANSKETSEIEDDADILLLLYRDRESPETDLIIAKNRNGPLDTIKLYFKKETATFIEMEKND